jgi:uncharacterized membrane protein YagU involved in acid resistance
LERILFGALAGLTATTAMTAAMRLFHGALPEKERYPLPPRELIEQMNIVEDAGSRAAATVAAHYAFGATAGIVYALMSRRMLAGPGYGVAVWAASYLGWIPSARLLDPASLHPARRNLLMIAAHLIWGAALEASYRTACGAARDVFSDGPALDAAGNARAGAARGGGVA